MIGFNILVICILDAIDAMALLRCSDCGVTMSHLQVEVVSSSCAASPQMQATINVLQLPPNESFST